MRGYGFTRGRIGRKVIFMRAILAGLVLLSLTAAAAAQATGDVEAIGFAGGYRSGCWTPMLVRLQATTGKTQSYKLVVVQKDLDKDHIFFSETIPLQGNPEGTAARDQRFWMYFIPDPSPSDGGGIPQGQCNADLNAAIRVLLYNDRGRESADYDRPLMQLNVTQAVQAIEYGIDRAQAGIVCQRTEPAGPEHICLGRGDERKSRTAAGG